jgi:hypothetical protein
MSDEILEESPVKQNPDEPIDEVFDEATIGRKPINYQLIIDLGLNRIHTIVSKPSNPESIATDTTVFRRSVSIYALMLIPYENKAFRDKKKELFEKFDDEYQEAMNLAQQKGEIITLQAVMEAEWRYSEALFAEIMKLLHRNSMLIRKKVLLIEKS